MRWQGSNLRQRLSQTQTQGAYEHYLSPTTRYDKRRYQHSMKYIQYKYNIRIQIKDRHVWERIVSILGITLPPLQRQGRVMNGQNTQRIDHCPLARSAASCGPLHVILLLPKVSHDFGSASSNRRPGGKYSETKSDKILQIQQSHIARIINIVVYEALRSHEERRIDNKDNTGGT